jgi:hypothetical protein
LPMTSATTPTNFVSLLQLGYAAFLPGHELDH